MITGGAKLAGVMGWPIKHSLSPKIHGYWLNSYKIDGAYIPLGIHPKDLEVTVRALPKFGFSGVNITLPHKERVLTILDRLAPNAARIGAVNTLVIGGSGELVGSNTDGVGFIQNLSQNAPMFSFNGSNVTVIGAGGAARAIIVTLLDYNVAEIRLINRTYHKALWLAEEIGDSRTIVLKWEDMVEAVENSNLLINTTSLGMEGQPALEISLENLAPNAIVSDIVYTPLMTPLLKKADQLGIHFVDGLGMLLNQARPGFEAWFGFAPEVTDDLRSFVLSEM